MATAEYFVFTNKIIIHQLIKKKQLQTTILLKDPAGFVDPIKFEFNFIKFITEKFE